MKIKQIKLNEDGNVVLQDGLPVYVYEDGSESPLDVVKTIGNYENRISNLTDEKERHQNNVKKLKSDYKDIDPEKAREALETVKNFKSKELLDANGIKALKSEMNESFQAEKETLIESHNSAMSEKDTVISTKNNTIKHLLVTSAFAKSDFFSGEKPKTIYPPDDAVAIFGNRFAVDGEGSEAKIIALGRDGKILMSQKNHGEPANFNEAIAKMIDEHPQKARIMNSGPGGPRAHGHPGGGYDQDHGDVYGASRIKKGLKDMKDRQALQ